MYVYILYVFAEAAQRGRRDGSEWWQTATVGINSHYWTSQMENKWKHIIPLMSESDMEKKINK